MYTQLFELKNKLNTHYDVFITSAGFEKRCLSIMNAIIDDITFTYRITFFNKSNSVLIKDHLGIFENKRFLPVEIDNLDQISTVNNFVNQINNVVKAQPNASFLVDITTFTRQ